MHVNQTFTGVAIGARCKAEPCHALQSQPDAGAAAHRRSGAREREAAADQQGPDGPGRAQHGQGNAFSLFQTAIVLETKVRERTLELERAPRVGAVQPRLARAKERRKPSRPGWPRRSSPSTRASPCSTATTALSCATASIWPSGRPSRADRPRHHLYEIALQAVRTHSVQDIRVGRQLAAPAHGRTPATRRGRMSMSWPTAAGCRSTSGAPATAAWSASIPTSPT